MVHEKIAELNEKLAAKDVQIVVQTNMAETMEKNIDQIINLALVGGLLAIFVLWMFLKNLKIVSIIALAIPVSVFTAFNLFYAFNISINSLTLVGLVLAIGMLLDNSVVVLENIYRLSGKRFDADTGCYSGNKRSLAINCCCNFNNDYGFSSFRVFNRLYGKTTWKPYWCVHYFNINGFAFCGACCLFLWLLIFC